MNPNDVIILTNSDGSTREMTYEAFERTINAKLRNTIMAPGSAEAKCTQRNQFIDEETGETRIICNFQACAPDQVEQIVEHVQNGEHREALNAGFNQGFRENSRYIPEQGEIVRLSIGFVESKALGKQVLRVMGVSPLPAATKKVNDLSTLLGARPSTPPVSAEPELTEETINAMNAADLAALADANNVDLGTLKNSQGKIAQKNLDAARALLVEELV